LFRAAISVLFALIVFSGCSSLKPYRYSSGRPNFLAEVQIEQAGFLERRAAGLFVFEVRGACEWFNHGFAELSAGRNEIALPVGKILVLEYTRWNASMGHHAESLHRIRFRPQAGQEYKVSARERGGSREVLFWARDAEKGSFREFKGDPFPNCERIKYVE
jgi:hypothetical protein